MFEHRTALENPGRQLVKYNRYASLGKTKEDSFTSEENRVAPSFPQR